MADGQPRRHHFVPRFYLSRWTDQELLDVRRRDGARFSAAAINVAVVNGFYDFYDEDGERSLAVEHFLSDEVEGPASTAFASIDSSGRCPRPGSDEREAMSAFIAFQMVRTPERRADMMLAESVRSFLDGRDLSEILMAEFLEATHLGFRPSQREIRAATMFIGFQLNQLDPGTHEEAMQIMHGTAVNLIPALSAMHWSIAIDRKERLITSDQPVVLWKRPSPRDAFEGVGVLTADEVRLPLDPSKQLVLRQRPRPDVVRLSPAEVTQCNRDMAERCHAFVISSPGQSAVLDAVPLRSRGPVVRFDVGHRYERNERGRLVRTDEEILHTWVSRD